MKTYTQAQRNTTGEHMAIQQAAFASEIRMSWARHFLWAAYGMDDEQAAELLLECPAANDGGFVFG